MKYPSCFIVSLILILTSCNHIVPPLDPSSYSPLQIGNEWHYYTFDMHSFGSDSIIVSVDSIVTINNKEYFVINSIEPVLKIDHYQVYVRKEDGKVFNLIDSVEYMSMDFNLSVNESWQQLPYPRYSTIISKSDSMITRNCTLYNCIRILSETSIDSTIHIIAPNIGTIYTQIRAKKGSGVSFIGGPTLLIWAVINNEKIVLQ